MFGVTVVLAIIGIGQLIVFRNQARRLKETIDQMQASEERQLRAYVFPVGAQLLDGSLAKPQIKNLVNVPGVHITLKNSGQTPAYRVSVWSDFKIMETRYESTGLNIPSPFPTMNPYSMPPGETSPRAHRHLQHLTAAEIAGLKNGSIALYVYGRIEYTDAFKKLRFTNFRLRHTGMWPPNPATIFFFCAGGNDTDQQT